MKTALINPIIEEDLERLRSLRIDWARFHEKSILITGASGFLPAYLVELLHSLGGDEGIDCKIYALARNPERAKERFAHLLGSPRFELIVQDVCDPINVSGNLDFIIHAASQASPKFYARDPVGTFNANVKGTGLLLDLAAHSRVQSFLFFSSGEVYGQVDPNNIPIKENDYGFLDPATVRSCYAEGKRAGENLCVCWHHQFGIPTRIVRPFHTYGPGMLLDDGRVFADFVADVVAGRDIVMKSDGLARRAFCYVADAAEAFIRVLLDGEIARPYNVGNPDSEVSVLELAQLMVTISEEINPGDAIKIIRSDAEYPEGYLKSPITRNSPDIRQLEKLGWKPSTSLREGFKRTILSYKK